MTFDKLWEKVPGLSDIAKREVPDALSLDTKRELERYSPFEVGDLVRSTIDEIEHGSIETIDTLIKKRIK